MKKIFLATVASTLLVGPANATPIVTNNAAVKSTYSGISPVHYRHRACKLDDDGWHRSNRWGRGHCRNRGVDLTVPLAALWLWRCADGHCGYWHRREHRWRDGWKGPGRRGHHRKHAR